MMKRLWVPALAVTLGVLIGSFACSEAGAPGTTANQSSPAPAAQTGGAQAAATPSPAAAAAGEPANVADIFPPGPGRETVLNSCGSCHNLACSAIGQRTAARWDSLLDSHKDKIPDADARAAFTYLKSHFNEANPEPKVPAKFLQGGCTPF
jgi:cytochrome c5